MVSDLFTERSQFEMMYQTLTELRRAHPPEDEILLQYLVPATCKAAAVLGMVSGGHCAWRRGGSIRRQGPRERPPPVRAGGLRSLWASRAVECAVVGEPHLGAPVHLGQVVTVAVRPELAVWGPFSGVLLASASYRQGPSRDCSVTVPCIPTPQCGCQPFYRGADRAFGVPLMLLQLMSTRPAPHPLSGWSSSRGVGGSPEV